MYMAVASSMVSLVLLWRHMRTPHPREGTTHRVLTEVRTAPDAVRLVRRLSTPSTTTEALAERLERLFLHLPPTEATMRALSQLQQRHEGEGGESEYCVALVFSIAIVSLCLSLPPRRAEHCRTPRSHPEALDLADMRGRAAARRAPPRRKTHSCPPPLRAAPRGCHWP